MADADISLLVEAVKTAPLDLSPAIRNALIEELQNPTHDESMLRNYLHSLRYQAPECNYEWVVACAAMSDHFAPILHARGVSPAVSHDLQRFMYQMLGGQSEVIYETVSPDAVAQALE